MEKPAKLIMLLMPGMMAQIIIGIILKLETIGMIMEVLTQMRMESGIQFITLWEGV